MIRKLFDKDEIGQNLKFRIIMDLKKMLERDIFANSTLKLEHHSSLQYSILVRAFGHFSLEVDDLSL
jgi:hypothetical protein